MIHPFHIAALRRYYRYLIRTGAIRLGDGQSPRRYVAYNEPVARFFHHDIAATLSAVAGEPLKPSYVYLASYLSGAELKKHTDREQCEFSVTLCLDFSPEPALATPWPIRLDTPTGTVTVYQALGDGLAYRGTRLPHYRSALGEGQTSTSIFFHYVAADFAGRWIDSWIDDCKQVLAGISAGRKSDIEPTGLVVAVGKSCSVAAYHHRSHRHHSCWNSWPQFLNQVCFPVAISTL